MLETDPPADGSAKMRLLRSMQASHYTMVTVQSTIPGLGALCEDGPARMPILIVDIGLSKSARLGMALATRVHSPGKGGWMTTGAALPLNEKAIERILRDMNEHKRRFGDEPKEQERTTMVIRACLQAGASRNITYANPDEDVPTRPMPLHRDTPRVGRNDPCPYGSGKKYKKCCAG